MHDNKLFIERQAQEYAAMRTPALDAEASKNAANIDYIAMMTEIDIPTEGEDENA